MIVFRGKRKQTSGLLLALLLITAQALALAHVYAHEIGTAQSQACVACATASQLASACVASPAFAGVDKSAAPVPRESYSTWVSAHRLVVRQRGPPLTL